MMTTLLRGGPRALLLGTVALAPAALAPAADAHDNHQRGAELYRPGVQHAAGAVRSTISARPPLYRGLGEISFRVTTTAPLAQAYFDQGLRLVWAFNHAEAIRAFRAAQEIDPGCAMCHWGEAFALGPNINDAMAEEAVPGAVAAARRAQALAVRVTPKERALIEAMGHRYSIDPKAERATLDRAFADVMRTVAAAYADDADVQVVFADALMNLQPWDYWEADRMTPKGAGGEIAATLERALAAAPNHPAALHLYIHAVEASADPARAEAAADRLRGAAPAAGHLVHMPAHIFVRVGRYADSIAVNRDAVAADEAMLEQMGAAASPLYRYGYYPHNVHFLMISAQMAGLAADVAGSAAKLARVTSDEMSEKLAWVQAIRTAPYAAHAQFSDAATILALSDPGDRFPFVRGYWHYARGIARVLAGDLAAAEAEAAAIDAIIEGADLGGLEAQFLPARLVLGIARDVVGARIAAARQDWAEAERLLRAAAEAEAGTGYMEPPYWYYPVRQTLGAVLLRAGRADEAVAAFEAALKQMPRNGWALWGLVQAKRTAGQDATAAEAEFARAWLGDTALLSLERL